MYTNLAKQLIETHGKSVGWIMLQLSCSHQSVQNWLKEFSRPARYYQTLLARLVKREEAKRKK